MKFFTSIISSCKDIAGKLRSVSAKANGRDVEDRQLMQQYGFISIPPSGSRILFLEFGNVIVGVASDGKERAKPPCIVTINSISFSSRTEPSK